MQSRKICYQADGLFMESELFYLESPGKKPGVLVFPEGFGLNGHALERAEMLAGLGYVALACDLHGKRHVIEDIVEMRAELAVLRSDVSRIRARARGGFDALSSCPEVDATRIAAIGYCFGGTMALELARGGAKIAATVGFHGGLATTAPQDAKNISGKVLVCIGAEDPAVPFEQRVAFEKEMREGNVNWQMTLFGGVVHSFTNPDADKRGNLQASRYDAQADARSWRQMRDLFEEVFKG